MANKNIYNEWKSYIQAIHDNGRRNLNFKKRLEDWEARRRDIIATADPQTEEIVAIDVKIASVRGLATRLNNALEAERAKLTKRQVRKGYQSDVMIECEEKIHSCAQIIKAYQAKRKVLVDAEVAKLLVEHDRVKPKSVELHREKDILDRFKLAFKESHIDAESLCLLLEEKTGKKYTIEYMPVLTGEDYQIAIKVLEHVKGYDASIIYSQIVDRDLRVTTRDLSNIKTYLADMYRIEDIILDNFETLESDSSLIFTHVLKEIEKKYFDILKEETKVIKK